MSPMATSTTSRSSTPAATRRRATRSRDRRDLEPSLVCEPPGAAARAGSRRQRRRRTAGVVIGRRWFPYNPTGVWVGDYTIQPENGGLGVFAHEFGHDLGLPDLYDTSGNTGGAENSTGFWTLMSSGANIGDGGRDGIGDDPTDMGAWEKFQLGWLGCAPVRWHVLRGCSQARRPTYELGPNGADQGAAGALRPPARQAGRLDLGAPERELSSIRTPAMTSKHDDEGGDVPAGADRARCATRSRRIGTMPMWLSRPTAADMDGVATNLSDRHGDQNGFKRGNGITGVPTVPGLT